MSKGPEALVREEIRALDAYHVPPAQGLVKLDAMESPYALPPELAKAMGERLAAVAVNRYPDPTARELKRAVRAAMRIPDALEILQIVSLALATRGATVLAPEPSFVVYRLAAIAAGMRYVGVPLEDDFSLDERGFLEAIGRERPALTWIAYPNNPTGNLFPRAAILAAIEASPGLVAVDEAYYPFAGGASLLDEVGRHPNLIVVRTFSKLGLAGLRLGVAIAPREWIAEFEKLRMPYNVNALTAAAAQLLLAHDEMFRRHTEAIVAGRAALARAAAGIRGVRVYPSAANFVLVRVADAPRAFEGLRHRGILVRNFHGSHPLLDHCLRLTVGTPDENARLIDALDAVAS